MTRVRSLWNCMARDGNSVPTTPAINTMAAADHATRLATERGTNQRDA